MHVLSTEVVTSAGALKQIQHPLALRRQALTSAMEVLAEIAGDSQGAGRGHLFLIVGLIEIWQGGCRGAQPLPKAG